MIQFMNNIVFERFLAYDTNIFRVCFKRASKLFKELVVVKVKRPFTMRAKYRIILLGTFKANGELLR